MIYFSSISGYAMPKHDIAPEQKGHDWCLEFSRYIYGQHQTSWWAQEQVRFPQLSLYADGMQDPNKYKSLFLDEYHDSVTDASFSMELDTETGGLIRSDARMAFTHINFDNIVSPAPAIRNTLLGIFSSQEHDAVINSIDEKSANEKNDIKYSLMAKMMFKDLYEKWQVFTGIQSQTPVPKSIEELALFESMGGFRLPYEIALEEIIQHANKLSDLPDIKDRVIDDIIKYNWGMTIDTVDLYGNVVKAEYIDPNDVILPYSSTKKYDDIPYWARQKYYTIQELRQVTGWDEEYIRGIAENFNGQIGNVPIDRLTDIGTYSKNGLCNYNDVRVVVIESEFLTVNSYYKTKVERTDGNKFNVDESFDDGSKRYNKNNGIKVTEKSKRTTTKTDLSCRYVAKWVVGSDRVFDYGRKYNEAFDYSTSTSLPGIHVYHCNGRSIIDLIIPLLDQVQMAYLRLQNDIANAPPAYGLAIEVGALADLSLGNKKLKPNDVIRLYRQKNVLLYQMKPPTIVGGTHDYNNVKPFEMMPGGIGIAIKDYTETMRMLYSQISSLTGIDQYTMNSITPSSEIKATEIRTAVANTKDTLKPVYNAWISILERQSMAIALRGHSLCLSDNNGYEKIIGRAKILAIKAAGKTPPAEYGISIIMRPTEADRQETRNAAMLATQGGKNGKPALDYSEYLFICERLNNGNSLKDIRAYIAFKERQKEEYDAKVAEQNQLGNAQVSAQIEDAKAQREIMVDSAKSKNQIQVEYFKTLFQGMLNEQGAEQRLREMGMQMGFDAGKMMNEQNMQQPQQEQGGMPQVNSEPPQMQQV